MDPSSLVSSIASQGVLGTLLALAIVVAWVKDRELKAERLARIEDAQKYNALAMDLQAKVIDAVNKVAAIMRELRKRSPVGVE